MPKAIRQFTQELLEVAGASAVNATTALV